MKFITSFSTVLALFLALPFTAPLRAQGMNPRYSAQMQQQQTQKQDRLVILDRVLERAGVPKLSTDQKDELETLIDQYRSTVKNLWQNSRFKSLHASYEEAIINGNTDVAQRAARQMASEVSNFIVQKLTAKANFEIKALQVLRDGNQLDQLEHRIGTIGVLSVLSATTGRGWWGRHHMKRGWGEGYRTSPW